MQQTFNLTSVVVTHEMESVKIIADRICMLHQGQIAGLGSLDQLHQSPHPFVQQFFARQPDADAARSEEYLRSLTGQE